MDLAKEFILRRPQFAARALEDQPPEIAARFLQDLPADLLGELLGRLMHTYAGQFFEQLDAKSSATLLATVSPEIGAGILRHTRADQRGQILKTMPSKAAGACRTLLRYADGTVGACMDSRVFVLPDDITVESSIRRMRRAPERTSGQIFVVNRKGRLRGVLQVWDIVRARRDALTSALTEPQRETLPVRAPLVSAANHPAWSESNELPVVETNGAFVGVLRHIRLRRALGSNIPGAATGQIGEATMEIAVDAWESAAALFDAVIAVASAPTQSRKER
jgi:Mg/Co/Ni transporter MgtE